jgi:hypothetical protein
MIDMAVTIDANKFIGWQYITLAGLIKAIWGNDNDALNIESGSIV